MFGKLKKTLKSVASDISKTVGNHIGNNTDNQVYETMHSTRYEYFAVVETSFNKYNGKLVDLPTDRGSVKGCSSSQEVLEKLTALLNAEFELCKKLNRPFPAKTSLEEVQKKYKSPFNSIVSIYPANVK